MSAAEHATQTETAKIDVCVQAQTEAAGEAVAEAAAEAAVQTEPPVTSRVESRATTATQQQQQQQQQHQQLLTPIPSRPPSTAASSFAQPNVVFVDNNRRFVQYQESTRLQRRHETECTPMVYSYNPDPRLRTWQSLEHARLHKLGLSSKLSRRYNVTRNNQFIPVGLHMRQAQEQQLPPLLSSRAEAFGPEKKNDVAPFLTFQKPTCGFYFSRETNNKKLQHGLAPADLPKWRFNQD